MVKEFGLGVWCWQQQLAIAFVEKAHKHPEL